MQRLFSAFPGSWPGFGLLVIRMSLAFQLIIMGYHHTLLIQPIGHTAEQLSLFALAGCLVLGIATPYVAALQVVVALWAGWVDHGTLWLHWSQAGVTAGLAMTGPGAWSVDALIFGRRRVEIPRR